MKSTLLLIVMFSFMLACNSISATINTLGAEYFLRQPMVIPQSITTLSPLPGQRSIAVHEICIGINEGGLWEDGDGVGDIRLETLELTIDARRVEWSTMMQVTGIYPKYDSQNKFVGYYGGPISACYTEPLRAGNHLATIRITTLSGKKILYTWAFSSSSNAPIN